MSYPGMGIGAVFLVYWVVILAIAAMTIAAFFRFVRAHERIASALETLAAKHLVGL